MGRRSLLTLSNLSEYILEGLVFNLDGTNKQESGSIVWKDTVQNIEYTNVGNVQEINKGFSFNGTANSLLRGNRLVSITENPNNYTIEVVINPTMINGEWAPIMSFVDWDLGNLYINTSIEIVNNNMNITHWTRRNTISYSYNIGSSRLATISLPGSRSNVFANLLEYSNYTTSSSTVSNKTTSFVGGRIDSNAPSLELINKTFSGNIYAIRLYNRKLTTSEILHNQQIDIKKYNITI